MLLFLIILSGTLAGILLISLFVLFLVRLLTRKSGIAQLGVRYPCPYGSPGTMRRLNIMGMNGITFKGSFSIAVSSDGLYLTTNRFFQWLGRISPALIPWDEIRVVEANKRINMRDAVALAIGDPPLGNMTLMRKDFEAMAPYIKPNPESNASDDFGDGNIETSATVARLTDRKNS